VGGAGGLGKHLFFIRWHGAEAAVNRNPDGTIMDAQQYIQRQHQRRNRVVLFSLAIIVAVLVLVFLGAWMLRQHAEPGIPEPGAATIAPDGYPDLEGHAVTMAGYDLTDEHRPYFFLIDPADNALEERGHEFESEPIRLPLLTDGRWWFVDYPGKAIGCIHGVLVIRESSEDGTGLPTLWKNDDLPDLSQHAVPGWGDNLCAPTATANLVWELGKSHPAVSPAQVFGLAGDASMELQANALIAGANRPHPSDGSLAALMATEPDAGTAFGSMGEGVATYLRRTMSGWRLNNPLQLDPDAFLETLMKESANGSGVVLLLYWGNLEKSEPGLENAVLMMLERAVEQSQTDSANPTTHGGAQAGNEEVEAADVIADAGGETVGDAADPGFSEEEIAERLKEVEAGSGDIQLSLAWDGYNDLDLSCTEPEGRVIDFEDRRSPSGGHLDVDMNATPQSKRPVENIFWPLGQAPQGEYRVYANYYRRHTSSRDAVKYSLRVVVGKQERFINGRLPPNSGRVLIHSFKHP
jgi:hypothetical protein